MFTVPINDKIADKSVPLPYYLETVERSKNECNERQIINNIEVRKIGGNRTPKFTKTNTSENLLVPFNT